MADVRKAFEDLFWARVAKGDGDDCWLWTARVDQHGFAILKNAEGARRASHVSLELCGHPISMGERIRVVCGSRRCVRPGHIVAIRLMPLADRFWAFVTRSDDGCWIWNGGRDQDGYGICKSDGRNRRATHIALELSQNIMVPKGALVMHYCDNPPCVRPSHLKIGTPKLNSEDMVAKGRSCVGNRNPSRIYPERLPRGSKHWTIREPERAKLLGRKRAGELHGNAKLTNAIVDEIRVRRAAGESQASLALEFGLNQSTISRIHTRKRWA